MTRGISGFGRRRLLLWAMPLLLALGLPALAEEEVLLSLPRDFDITVHPGGEVAPGQTYTPFVFRFRGERVESTLRGEGPHPHGRLVQTGRFEGTFRRGHLEGRLVYTIVDPFNRGRDEWEGKGMATPDGRLVLRWRLVAHEHRSMHKQEGWRDRTSEIEGLTSCPMPDIVLQLPVGQLQSSQEPATPPPPVHEPRSAAVGPGGRGAGDQSAGDAGVDSGRGAVPDAPSGGTGKATDPRVGAFEGAGGRSEESPWSVPVTPGEAAGAAAAVALTSLLGALWMFGTSGLSPGDLLGSAPEVEALEPPSAEAPPREVYVEGHRDGEVRPETGEVWSESVGGWVGENFHEIERRHQAEVRRAQDVSDRESRRESARIAEELRASRQREEAAARRGAEAADAAVRLEAVTVEPYQPGWTDHATTALEWAEWGTDTSVSVLGRLTGPAGEKGAEVYTVAKETVKGLSEGVADYARGRGGHVASEGSAWVILERGTIGASKGVAKVGLDRLAGDLMDGVADKLAGPTATVLTDVGDTVVTTVTRELRAGAVTEVRRSAGVELVRAVVGSEIQAPVKAGIEGLTGEKM